LFIPSVTCKWRRLAASLVWQLGSLLEFIQFDIKRIGLMLVG